MNQDSALAVGTAPHRAQAIPAGIVPAAAATSHEYFEREREQVFRRHWLNVGHTSELPRPGDYVLKNLPTLGAEIILVRGQDRQVRAFFNICTHRANKVVREQPAGNATGFSCNFHGWTYDLEGRLRHVPDAPQFPDLDPCRYGLRALAVGVWENFVFVHPAGDPAPQPLEDWLGEVRTGLAGGHLARLELSAVFRASVNVNWKVFHDAFSEGYHVATIHRRSIASAFLSRDNPYCNLTAVRLYEHHHVASVVGGNPDYRPTRAQQLVGRYGGSKYGVSSVELFGELPAGLNPQRHPGWAFDIVEVFPNFAAHVGPDYCYTYNFWPTAVDRTEWEMRLYQMPAQNLGELIARQYTAVVLRDTVREDINTTEATQQNLMSGLIGHLALGDQEMLLRHRYAVVDRCVRAAGAADA